MDELVKTVAEKAGIPESAAKAAIEAIADFLKEKLPAPFDSQIDGILSGNDTLDLGDVVNLVGGLLGKK